MSTDDLEDSEEEVDNESIEDLPVDEDTSNSSGKFDKLIVDEGKKYKLTGMYRDWFLDYASYVILERAVPHINDGLKPVQRRILHAMKLHDDGRLNKVASLVGATMPFHPHGDASIKDALVQLGQKDLLVDCQGNWGNILTGDAAAAGRYIEARLTDFANEVVFNNKTTEWVNSYDGRNKEPVNLPVKFPLLLAQGSEGIAVGLACKILPHNFNELIDASISYLRGEDFHLEPDFPTGGLADTTSYNNGMRGGKVRIRATIEKLNKNTIAITEIPFGTTTGEIQESILKASEKGKIKIKKIDDNTAAKAEIIITLPNDISPDKTIDALYACTNCEVSISPNCCVIKDKKPHFMGVDEILKYNTETTKSLLTKELEIRLAELEAEWHYSSLEKIFFENKVYKVLENDAKNWENQLADVMKEMLRYQDLLRSPITSDDIDRLVEKPVRKISKFDIKAVNQKIKGIEDKEKTIKNDLAHIVRYTIDYFASLKKKYGDKYPRRTTITVFRPINERQVIANNAKLYANKAEGFIGLSQKKIEDAEYICECSDIDEIIVFIKDGRYIVTKVSDKAFIEKGIIHVAVFHKSDRRTIYNAIYRDGRQGVVYAKRFAVTGITRDKWYNLTKGKEGSMVLWFTSNANGEAGSVKVHLKPKPKLKKLYLDFDFAQLAIKNKTSQGNIVTKNPILKITLKTEGVSTIGGRSIWFDWDVNRLNEESRGELLGEFRGHEHILALCKNGTFYTTNLDLSNRFQGEVLKVEKFDSHKVYSVIYWDAVVKCYYIKRFCFVLSDNTVLSFISEEEGSRMVAFSTDEYPQVKITFPANAKRPKEPEYVDVEDFIGIKGFRAKGKRATSNGVENIEFVEPLAKSSPTNKDITLDDDLYNDAEVTSDEETSDKTSTSDTKAKKASESFGAGSVVDLKLDDDLTLF